VTVAVGVAEGVRVFRGGRGVEVSVAVDVGLEILKLEQPDRPMIPKTNNEAMKV